MSVQKVAFVYLGEKLPKYANASLEISQQNSGLDITFLGNSILKKQIKRSNVEFIPVEDFYNPINFMEIVSRINLPIAFRQGFWAKTLERLFVLHQYMEVYKVQNIFHAELDQILFRCDRLLKLLEESDFKGIAFPFHTIDRGVASVLYCNDVKSLESILNFTKELPGFNNEMELIAQWAINNSHMVKLLPTVASEVKKSDIFQRSGLEIISPSTIGGVVDALQIGQWVSGQDPRNVNIRFSPKNKYVESPSEEILTFNELLKLELNLSTDGSLLVSYDQSHSHKLYNVHIHSKIHPWIVSSNGNLARLFNESNRSEPIGFPGLRWVQISNFIATGFHSVSRHPIKFLKRVISRLFKLLTKSTFR
jgi:hypothetical protein